MKVVIKAVQDDPLVPDLSESLYAKLEGEKFSRIYGSEKSLPLYAENVYRELYAHISNKEFSCTGAKAALRSNIFRVGLYNKMNTQETTSALGRDLRQFAREQKQFSSNYASFAAIFSTQIFDDEKIWEKALWSQLENLNKLDAGSDWDPTVSDNPEDANFSYSFAGTGFFIVGLHPNSSRKARRFSRAAMIFNPHAQFDRLRELNQYERLQTTIRARELKLQDSLNPNLSDFGTRSEARQYSGRAVEDAWKCPFHAQIKKSINSET